mmetsp:Transcript_1991/g.6030  ORF Transcript_1991/g.6030 Transcript_1991/m.6030 type:complete len:180 (-) Transcript_1991:135-674(-)
MSVVARLEEGAKEALAVVPSVFGGLCAAAGVGDGAKEAPGSPNSDVDSRPVGELLLPEGPALNVAVVKPWLRKVYARYNPKKLHRVDQLLKEYHGREAELVAVVSHKYRLDPSHFERHYSRTQRSGECGSLMCTPMPAGCARPMFLSPPEGAWPEEEHEVHNKLQLPPPQSRAPSRPSR